MKYIISMLIVAITTLIGKKLGDYFIEREKFFNYLQAFTVEVKRMISYLKTPIMTIKDNFGEKISDIITSPNACEKIIILKREEKDKLYSFFSNLGKFDSESELFNVTEMVEYAIEKQRIAEKDREKKAPFCIKMGFLIGLFILIIVL